jgi:hypothetical protein
MSVAKACRENPNHRAWVLKKMEITNEMAGMMRNLYQ